MWPKPINEDPKKHFRDSPTFSQRPSEPLRPLNRRSETELVSNRKYRSMIKRSRQERLIVPRVSAKGTETERLKRAGWQKVTLSIAIKTTVATFYPSEKKKKGKRGEAVQERGGKKLKRRWVRGVECLVSRKEGDDRASGRSIVYVSRRR